MLSYNTAIQLIYHGCYLQLSYLVTKTVVAGLEKFMNEGHIYCEFSSCGLMSKCRTSQK